MTLSVCSDTSSRFATLFFFFLGDRDGLFSPKSWLLLEVASPGASLVSVTSATVALGDYKKEIISEFYLYITCCAFVRCLGFFLLSLASTAGAGVSIIIGAGVWPLPADTLRSIDELDSL